MSDEKMIHAFSESFRAGVSTCHAICNCGCEYYDEVSDWDWQEGEMEALEEKGAVAVSGSIGILEVSGREYAEVCNCWHGKAVGIIRFIEQNDRHIADFLRERKARAVRKASRLPDAETP